MKFLSSKDVLTHIQGQHMSHLPASVRNRPIRSSQRLLVCEWRGCENRGRGYVARYKLLRQHMFWVNRGSPIPIPHTGSIHKNEHNIQSQNYNLTSEWHVHVYAAKWNGQLSVSDLPVIWLVNDDMIILRLGWHHHHPIGGALVTLLDSAVAAYHGNKNTHIP